MTRAAATKALRSADRIFVDETRAPVLYPGRKATKSGYFWTVLSDDGGHGGTGPPIVLFHYAPGRGKQHPLKFLAGYRGRFLQCDAYQSHNSLTEIARENGLWQLVYCWIHVRRRFVKRLENEGKANFGDLSPVKATAARCSGEQPAYTPRHGHRRRDKGSSRGTPYQVERVSEARLGCRA